MKRARERRLLHRRQTQTPKRCRWSGLPGAGVNFRKERERAMAQKLERRVRGSSAESCVTRLIIRRSVGGSGSGHAREGKKKARRRLMRSDRFISPLELADGSGSRSPQKEIIDHQLAADLPMKPAEKGGGRLQARNVVPTRIRVGSGRAIHTRCGDPTRACSRNEKTRARRKLDHRQIGEQSDRIWLAPRGPRI